MPLANAEKQARFRARRHAELEALRRDAQALLDALSSACERGRCPSLTNHLPDETWEACAELTRRLGSVRLIAVKPE